MEHIDHKYNNDSRIMLDNNLDKDNSDDSDNYIDYSCKHSYVYVYLSVFYLQNVEHIDHKYNSLPREICRTILTNSSLSDRVLAMEVETVMVSFRNHLIFKLESWKWSPAVDLHQGWYHRGDLMVIWHVDLEIRPSVSRHYWSDPLYQWSKEE